jgi:hypothetical protein
MASSITITRIPVAMSLKDERTDGEDGRSANMSFDENMRYTVRTEKASKATSDNSTIPIFRLQFLK